LNDADEGYMAGVRFAVAQGNTLVGEGVSSGTATPVCFDGLPAGTYQIGQTLPNTLEPTTATNITVDLQQGQTLGLEFGTRVKGSGGAIATTQPAPAPTEIAQGGNGGSEAGDNGGVANPETPATGGESDGGGLPTWAIVAIVVGGLAFLAMIGLVVYLVTQLQKQNAS
ncbi:MAG: hypothetical protein KDD89_07030, partial [Anaerolineales bacterium]|nr:hypothetical protein [Anaerolineales bacterium]